MGAPIESDFLLVSGHSKAKTPNGMWFSGSDFFPPISPHKRSMAPSRRTTTNTTSSKSAAGRPEGTDGSDYKYRMTVESSTLFRLVSEWS